MLERFMVGGFRNLELKFFFSEFHIFSRDETVKENVDTCKKILFINFSWFEITEN